MIGRPGRRNLPWLVFSFIFHRDFIAFVAPRGALSRPQKKPFEGSPFALGSHRPSRHSIVKRSGPGRRACGDHPIGTGWDFRWQTKPLVGTS